MKLGRRYRRPTTRRGSIAGTRRQGGAIGAEREAHISKEKGLEALAEAKKRELELLNDEERKLDMELAALSRRSSTSSSSKPPRSRPSVRSRPPCMAAEAAERRIPSHVAGAEKRDGAARGHKLS